MNVGEKPRVFISYSRSDLAFVDQLSAVLDWQGFQTIIDREGVHGAENWEERLGQLILEADIVVFVLSPDSAASETCSWEVEEAARRGKRIVPVLCHPLEKAQPHSILRALNYIHFYPESNFPGSGFGEGLVKLVEALSIDISWLREHTRLEELAARWDGAQRPSDLLARGSELAGYKDWRDMQPQNAPPLTDLQRAFLTASEDEETARASTERIRLDEMAAAQAERQAAIEEREKAFERAATAQQARAKLQRILTWGGVGVAMSVVVGAVVFAKLQSDNSLEQAKLAKSAKEKEQQAVAQKGAVDQLIRRIRVGSSNKHGTQALKKICSEAISVTSNLAKTQDRADYDEYENRFLELYFGPMNLIELREKTDEYSGNPDGIVSSSIETSMVKFHNELRQIQNTPHPHSTLLPFSHAISGACHAFFDAAAQD